MRALTPLQPVQGGVVDPDDQVGRERELHDLLQAVATGGAYVVGDRRMGKTSLLRRAVRDLRPAGHLVVTVSAETQDLATFNEAVLHAVRTERIFSQRWRSWTKEFSGEVRLSTSANGFRLTGKLAKPGELPETDLMQLCARAADSAGAASFILVVDEVAQLAYFLHESDPASGAELLRAFRRLRQDGDHSVRVVLAGSVGLQHAVDDSTSLNDLPRISVGPLRHRDAVELAQRLLLGVRGTDHATLAEAVAHSVSDIAFYVQKLVAGIGIDDTPLEEVDVVFLVGHALDTNDWGTDHYFHRIPKYYPGQEHLVVELLDGVAADGAVSVAELTRQMLVRVPEANADERTLSILLEKLTLDHYLVFTRGAYRFSSPFLAQVWTRIRERLS